MDAEMDDELHYLFESAWGAADPSRWVRQLEKHAARPGDHRGQALALLGELAAHGGDLEKAERLFREAVATGDEGSIAPQALLGNFLAEAGRVAEGIEQLRAALETQDDASTFGYVGEGLESVGELLLALDVMERGYHLHGTDHLRGGRYRLRRTLGLAIDALDQQQEQVRAEMMAVHQQRMDVFDEEAPVHLAIAFDEQQWATWGAENTGGPTSFDDFRAATEADFRLRSTRQSIRLVPFDEATLGSMTIGGFDPRADRDSLRLYASLCEETGLTRPWPPGRNESCWCGSAEKYKRCCLRR